MKERSTEKYIGFEIPNIAWHRYDWLYNIIENREETIFYTIDSVNIYEAQRKVFDELIKEWGIGVDLTYATDRARHILEDVDENEIIKRFGEYDGDIIIKISRKFLDLDEETQSNCLPHDEFIDLLSKNTIYQLAFERKQIDIGIVKIKKNL